MLGDVIMKDKLDGLKAGIKAKLDEAEGFIQSEDFEQAEATQAEVAELRTKYDTVKSVIEAKNEEEVTILREEVASVKEALETPQRLPFSKEDSSEKVQDNSPESNFLRLRYGDPENALKAVMKDLYGKESDERRYQQHNAFVKYLRFGDSMLHPEEHTLLIPNGQNIMLQPDVVKSEIEGGRTVSEIKATLEEGSGDLGGYLVPEDIRAEIISRLVGATVIRGKARVITTTRDAVEIPKLEGGNSRYTSGVRVTWVDETPASASAAESNPTFGMLRIPVNTVMARTDMSRNMLEDSAFNMIEMLSDLFAEAMAIDEDEQFLTGTGGGRPKGVLGNRSGAEKTPYSGIAEVVTGGAATLTADGLINLVYDLDVQYRKNAAVIMAKDAHKDVRQLKDSQNRYLWQPDYTTGSPSSLLGYPIYESEALPSVAANAFPLIFGDLRAGYMIVDRVGMSIERVSDSTTVGQNKVALFARRRIGGQVVAPWAFRAHKCST